MIAVAAMTTGVMDDVVARGREVGVGGSSWRVWLSGWEGNAAGMRGLG